MAQRISRKQLKQDEFIEAAWSFEHWVEENWRLLLKWIVAAIAIFAIGMAWLAWSRHSRAQAERDLADAVAVYERARSAGVAVPSDLEQALESFQAIQGGATGRVSRFYEGATLLELGRYDAAAASLEQAAGSVADADTLGVTAHAMLVRVYTEAGRTDDAQTLLTQLVDSANPSVPTDQMLLMLGGLYKDTGQTDEARETFQRIIDEFPDGAAVLEARELVE